MLFGWLEDHIRMVITRNFQVQLTLSTGRSLDGNEDEPIMSRIHLHMEELLFSSGGILQSNAYIPEVNENHPHVGVVKAAEGSVESRS